MAVSLEKEQKRSKNEAPRAATSQCGQEKRGIRDWERTGRKEEHHELMVLWKQLPFPFKCYPVFPVSSHTSPSTDTLNAILGQLGGYWQKTCELNWQNSPANSFHPTVSALKIVGLCTTKRSLLYRYMNNKIMEMGSRCQYRARADEILAASDECFLLFITLSSYIM